MKSQIVQPLPSGNNSIFFTTVCWYDIDLFQLASYFDDLPYVIGINLIATISINSARLSFDFTFWSLWKTLKFENEASANYSRQVWGFSAPFQLDVCYDSDCTLYSCTKKLTL